MKELMLAVVLVATLCLIATSCQSNMNERAKELPGKLTLIAEQEYPYIRVYELEYTGQKKIIAIRHNSIAISE